MARTKKPENETEIESITRQKLETVANAATRSEKTSWNRKMENMVKLLTKLKPYEDKMLDLIAKKQPLMDEVAQLRSEMVQTCVHPYTHLILHEGVIKCKFCNSSFVLKTE